MLQWPKVNSKQSKIGNKMTLNPALEMNEQETMRARIMNQAASLFVTRGYAGISMREIAEAVGVSKAGLYYHFKDKEDLFIDILKDNLEEIERIVTKAYQSSPDVFSRLRNMTIWIFQQPPQQRAVIRLASQEMGNINPKVRAEFQQSLSSKIHRADRGHHSTGNGPWRNPPQFTKCCQLDIAGDDVSIFLC